MSAEHSQPRPLDFLFFLAADEAFFPKAVLTGFGKCAIVRFLFAADAAFLCFSLPRFFVWSTPFIYTVLFSVDRNEF
jgi:hypothetical protein